MICFPSGVTDSPEKVLRRSPERRFLQIRADDLEAVELSEEDFSSSQRPEVAARIVQIPFRFLHHHPARDFENCGMYDPVVVRRRTVGMASKQFLGIERKQDVVAIEIVEGKIRRPGASRHLRELLKTQLRKIEPSSRCRYSIVGSNRVLPRDSRTANEQGDNEGCQDGLFVWWETRGDAPVAGDRPRTLRR